MSFIYASEGLRMFARSLKRRFFRIKKYSGDENKICRQIVDDCFNGKYFQVSKGHFCEFYTRDFGFCIDSLIWMGYIKEVRKTLAYALEKFEKSNNIATTISPSGRVFDFPRYSVDSLPYLIRSLAVSKSFSLAKKHKDFLNNEIRKFKRNVVDNKTGLVRKDRYFSSMKDHSLRESSCYDNVFLWVLSEYLKEFSFLENPFGKYDYKRLIKDNFWTGEYFLDDLSGRSYVSGDANVIPFWIGLFDSRKMIRKAFKKIHEEGLDSPFPLSYGTLASKEEQNFSWFGFFASDYETDTVWTHLGLMYLKMLGQVDRKLFLKHKRSYGKIILKYGNFLETFTKKGKPYRTPFYFSDESMLWSANYLTLS